MWEGAASRAATVEKKRWLQKCSQYEKECEVMQFRLIFSFLLDNRTLILGAGRRFRLVLHVFFRFIFVGEESRL